MPRDAFAGIAAQLAAVGRRFYARGWALGTSGNFSAVVSREPFRLAITASAVHKGGLLPAHILRCDEHGAVVGRRQGRPSAEARLHVEIARRRAAGAVLHTHSVWTTVLSDFYAGEGGFGVEGYEMLKGLDGVASHDHREWVPIVENDQDMGRLARRVADTLNQNSAAHAIVLLRHGLYTWGTTLADAERQVEILEFLFEVVGRTLMLTGSRRRNTMMAETLE
ncbi:MAG TPA: methylthioribulose 1-phosphate dehydratase [Vicinamibacterales bacterium]